MLDDISLYWLTNSGAAASQSNWVGYGENPFNAIEIDLPVAVNGISW